MREDLGELAGWVTRLAGADGSRLSDAELIGGIDALERVKAACAAAQARLTARFVQTQSREAARFEDLAQACSDAGDFDGWVAARDRARALRLPPEQHPQDGGAPDRGGQTACGAGGGTAGGSRRRRQAALTARTGVSAQVALARHESPARGARLARAALTLVQDLPHTMAALGAGHLSERRAELVVKTLSHLSPALRAVVDAEVIGTHTPTADDPPGTGLAGWGDREVERRVKACADRLDPAAATARARAAAADRRVTSRPVPDCMAAICAVLPVQLAVAVYAALTQAADTAKAAGDPRTRAQVMADTLVERVTGTSTAEDLDVHVQLVITDRTLLHGDDTPAHIPGYGPVPAGWARDLLTPDPAPPPPPGATTRPGAQAWLRRLYTHPGTGTLVAMDSTQRLFPAGLRRYLLARDGVCRTPWCDAPIRHADHIAPHAQGGPTTDTNGQGLCITCNLTKDLPGWRSRVTDRGPTSGSRHPHTVTITTPTGHTYTSTAPPVLPGHVELTRTAAVPDLARHSPIETALTDRLAS